MSCVACQCHQVPKYGEAAKFSQEIAQFAQEMPVDPSESLILLLKVGQMADLSPLTCLPTCTVRSR